MKAILSANSCTARGPRASNQDAVDADADLGFAVVADGMGGAAGGELASQTTVTAVRSTLRARAVLLRHRRPPAVVCEEAAAVANRRVWDAAETAPELHGMGSTLALVCISGNRFCAANIGDSRVYRVREGLLTQLSHDHSRVQERVDAGLITAEQARTQPDRNVITRVIGVQKEVAPHLVEGGIRAGDLFLLTSDGVHGVLSDRQLLSALSGATDSNPAQRLVRMALGHGSRDNATAALLRVEQVGSAGRPRSRTGVGFARLARLFCKG